MSTFKKTKVVMLPTNEKAGAISIGNQSKVAEYHFFQHEKGGIYNNHTFQHLYFLSDEEIKEGDWCIIKDHAYSKPIQVNKIIGSEVALKTDKVIVLNQSLKDCNKIIATTDKSLTINSIYGVDRFDASIFSGSGKSEMIKLPQMFNLPQPSQSFIEKFVEEYNKSNQITEVNVEYEEYAEGSYGLSDGEPLILERLKINPKDNTITIRKVNLKGEHVLNFVNDFIKEFPEENLEYLKLRAELWIEENL